MALSNIQQVDNILVALNTSEEAVKKDLEVLKIPSFAVLEQSGLGDTPVNSFYDELKARKSPSPQHGKSTSLRRLSHLIGSDKVRSKVGRRSRPFRDAEADRVYGFSSRENQRKQGKLLSPRRFNKQIARSLGTFRHISKVHGLQGVRRQEAPPQHWHNGLRTYHKNPEEKQFELTAKDSMHKFMMVQRLEAKNSVIMPTNDAVPYDTNFDLQQSNVTQEPLRKFPPPQQQLLSKEAGMGPQGGGSDENVTSKRIHASRNKVDAVNMALNERFEEIKSTVVGEVPHEASATATRLEEEEKMLNEHLLHLNIRLKNIKDKSPKNKRKVQKIRKNKEYVKKLMRDDKNEQKDKSSDIQSDEEYQPTFAELEPHQQKLYFMTLQPSQRDLLMKTLNGASSQIINEDTLKISEDLQVAQASSGVDGMLDADHNGVEMGPSGKERLMKDDLTRDADVKGDKAVKEMPNIPKQIKEETTSSTKPSKPVPSIAPPQPPSPPPGDPEGDGSDQDSQLPKAPTPPPLPPNIEFDSSSDDSDSSYSSDNDSEGTRPPDTLIDHLPPTPGTPNSVDSDIPPPPSAPPPPLML